MKIMKTMMAMAAIALAIGNTAHARLGWTLQECENAWGVPIQTIKASGAPSYMFRAQSNLYVQVALLNSKVESLVYFSRNDRFLLNHINELLQRNCDGVWSLYDDYRGKQTAKSWQVVSDDGNMIAYALLWNYPEAHGYYRLQLSSFVWASFLGNNGGNNDKPISNIDELNI